MKVFRFVPILLLLLVPSIASAEGDAEVAQGYFDAGVGLYVEGKYGEALLQFRRGYAELANPMFPYSIALCNLKLGRLGEAMQAAEEARQLGGLGDNEFAQNDALITAVPLIQKARETADTISKTAPKEVPRPTPTPAPATVAAPPQPQSSGFGALGWVGVGSTVLGAGALIGAAVVERSLEPKFTDYEEAAEQGDRARYDQLRDEISSGQNTGMAMVYVGSGLLAVGATLIIIELVTSDSESTTVSIGPSVGPQSVGGQIDLRF